MRKIGLKHRVFAFFPNRLFQPSRQFPEVRRMTDFIRVWPRPKNSRCGLCACLARPRLCWMPSKAPLAPADRAEWQRDEAVARAQLNESAYQHAREDGRRLSMEQAMDYALGKSR